MSIDDNEIELLEECPCGSGDIYEECCFGKRFKWVRNESGEISRAVPLTPEIRDVLDSTREDFIHVMGREPRGDDPVFLGQYL